MKIDKTLTMKILLILSAFFLFSFATQEEKKVTISFTKEEVGLIYNALGDLPAKQVEGLRAKIVYEYLKVFPDSTGKK